VRKSYGDLRAVDGVSFEVDEGEFFGILGPNGAGKTTTLEMIEGLREPDGGEVSVLGMTPWPRHPALLPKIGVQLQASSFFERLTAREQLRTFASLYGVPPQRADETVGLTRMAGTRTEKLSGGQAQRLSIACAPVHGPTVLFLDEPTGSLDPQARRNLWDLLRAIAAEGRTVVLTTHHMDEAETLCERVAVMDHGKILQLGRPSALIRGLGYPVRISIDPGQLRREEAEALVPPGEGADAAVTEDAVALTITTTEPAAAALPGHRHAERDGTRLARHLRAARDRHPVRLRRRPDRDLGARLPLGRDLTGGARRGDSGGSPPGQHSAGTRSDGRSPAGDSGGRHPGQHSAGMRSNGAQSHGGSRRSSVPGAVTATGRVCARAQRGPSRGDKTIGRRLHPQQHRVAMSSERGPGVSSL
jgi:ABC-2 type transport system ATP-binding protein